ncbi:protein of unknown function [Methylocella tundrae]|uniref:Uncharacterized protein n=1 Tax=Methylocella tundrae TaxID=227605 RepID=A0A4U8Z3R6_METTU|nr:protein of unknown function [Methylocella tundrae]
MLVALEAKRDVFTPAFVQALGIGGKMDLIFLILFAVALGAIYLLIIRPLQKRARENAGASPAGSAVLQSGDTKPAGSSAEEFSQNNTLSTTGAAAMEDGADIESLMSAVRDQAVELRCEHAKTVSNLSLSFDVLTNRLATIEPLLAKAMEAAGKSEASVALLTASNDEYRHKLAEAERDLGYYRPLAMKLDDDLRIARNHLTETERKFAALESDYAKTQGAANELFQKMASAELARQRAAEENVALVQRLNEHDFTIQSLLRETAVLKSETVSVASDLERAERESKSVADKYAVELEGASRAKTALNSLQAEFSQFRKDSAAQIEQIEERERVSAEALSIKEKQFYDSEIKQSALNSKVDFLTRTNQRLREDLRSHLDHIGNLEASNRKLLDLLARNSAADEQEVDTRDLATAGRTAPKLRAVSDTQTGASVSTKALPPDRS